MSYMKMLTIPSSAKDTTGLTAGQTMQKYITTQKQML